MTKIIHVDYDRNIKCPKWKSFLETVLPDVDLQRFVQKAVGYSLTGKTDEQALFFLYGLGANGKSTFIETIRRLFGDYAQKTDIEALLDSNRGGNANPYTARLFRTRFVVSSEIPDGKRFNESLIKDLTGSDVLVARKLYQEPFEFEPTHKLWLVGNYKPKVVDMSTAFWRRMRVIPFTVTIPKANQRPLSEILKEFELESSGILSWIIDGAILWKVEGLKEPKAVENATEEYRTEQDILRQFIDEECEIDSNYQILKETLFQKLSEYLAANGEKQSFTKKKLTRELSIRGFESGGNGRKYILGIRSIPPESIFLTKVEDDNRAKIRDAINQAYEGTN